MVFGTNESAYFVSGKVFDAYDEVEKIIYFGNQYIIESHYLNVDNQRIYFRPDGPAIIFKTENGEEKKISICLKTRYLKKNIMIL